MDPKQKQDEEHFRRIEAAILYADDAARRIGRMAGELEQDGCDPHYVEALRGAAESIREEHRRLVSRVYFRAPEPEQGDLLSDRLAS